MIFSIAMGADCSFYVKSFEIHARAFLPLNISAVGSVIYPIDNKNVPLQSFTKEKRFEIGRFRQRNLAIQYNTKP